jgi:ribonuclease-3 family protein
MAEGTPREDWTQLPALLLAYVGDAVFELSARLYVLQHGAGRLKDIHQATVLMVRAAGQADFLRRIEPLLNEEEQAVVRRGRNTKGQPPKNADVLAYRKSTGLEALWGYLFLTGQTVRLETLFARLPIAEES